MAPEQLRGAPLDSRADLFSVGVMLWEAIAGHCMHAEPNVYEIVKRFAEGTLPKLRDAAPEVSASLEQIVSRALALKPEDRYPDARSFRDDLLRLPELGGISARDVGEKLQSLFIEERRKLNQMIHDVMRSATNRASSPEPPTLLKPRATMEPSTNASDSKSGSTAPTTVPIVPLAFAPTNAISPVPAPAPPRRFERMRSLRWATLGVVASALLVFVLSRASAPTASRLAAPNPGHDTIKSSSRQDTVNAAAEPPEASSATTNTVVRVQILAEPSGVNLILDGSPLPQNPYEGIHTRDSELHVLELSAEGYRRHSLPLNFDRDVDVSVALEALGAPVVSDRVAQSSANPAPKSRETGVQAVPTRAVPSSPYSSFKSRKMDDSHIVDLPPSNRTKRPFRANEPRSKAF